MYHMTQYWAYKKENYTNWRNNVDKYQFVSEFNIFPIITLVISLMIIPLCLGTPVLPPIAFICSIIMGILSIISIIVINLCAALYKSKASNIAKMDFAEGMHDPDYVTKWSNALEKSKNAWYYDYNDQCFYRRGFEHCENGTS